MKYWMVRDDDAYDIEITRQDGKIVGAREAIQTLHDFMTLQDEITSRKGN